jgi:hypothetical protein
MGSKECDRVRKPESIKKWLSDLDEFAAGKRDGTRGTTAETAPLTPVLDSHQKNVSLWT